MSDVLIERTEVIVAEPGSLQTWIDAMKKPDSNLAMVASCDDHVGFDCGSDSSYIGPRHTYYVFHVRGPDSSPTDMYKQLFSNALAAFPRALRTQVRVVEESINVIRIQVLFGMAEVPSQFAVILGRHILDMPI